MQHRLLGVIQVSPIGSTHANLGLKLGHMGREAVVGADWGWQLTSAGQGGWPAALPAPTLRGHWPPAGHFSGDYFWEQETQFRICVLALGMLPQDISAQGQGGGSALCSQREQGRHRLRTTLPETEGKRETRASVFQKGLGSVHIFSPACHLQTKPRALCCVCSNDQTSTKVGSHFTESPSQDTC